MAQHPVQTATSALAIPTRGNSLPATAAATAKLTLEKATANYTKEEIKQAWTEHAAPNNAKYYYNAITKESTYEKPECLMENESSNLETEKSTASKQVWTEYTDPNTGKKYYSDGVTTRWERPKGMEGTTESKIRADAEEEEAPRKKKRKKATENDILEFSNKEEATAAFKGLLLAKGVQPTTKWNDVVKMCSSDSRWETCEVLALGERKQALAEYQTKRANDLRTLERQERMRAKEAFVQLLTEKLPTVPDFSATNSQYSDMRDSLSKDDRFYAVEKEETRESLFLDFCEEVRKRQDRKRRSKKRDAKDAFVALLKEHEESGLLTFASTWYVKQKCRFFTRTQIHSRLTNPAFFF
jgi:pre-mRNA-processing factor 40